LVLSFTLWLCTFYKMSKRILSFVEKVTLNKSF